MKAVKGVLVLVALLSMVTSSVAHDSGTNHAMGVKQFVKLPEPQTDGGLSVEKVLSQRRSIRTFDARPLQLSEVGQLLWSAQGITSPDGLRASPSAGALYPLELYLVAGKVNDLPVGIYHYLPKHHELEHLSKTDIRTGLARAALGQNWLREATAVVVFAAVYRRTTRKYGERGIQYAHIEAGHAAENLFLQATSLGLNTVVVGAFRDGTVRQTLGLPEDHVPLMVMPVGR